MRIGVVARCRDEDRILCDWVGHYRTLGFDKIWIFDMCSKTPVMNVLREKNMYQENDICVIREERVIDYPYDTIKDNMDMFGCVDWLLCCDMDEFLVVNNGTTVKDYIGTFSNADIIHINWLTFGAGHRETYDYSRKVFEQFTLREPYDSFWNHFGKSLIKMDILKEQKHVGGNLNAHIPLAGYFANQDMGILNRYNAYDSRNKRIGSTDIHSCCAYSRTPDHNSPAYILHYMTLDFENMLEKREKYISAGIDPGTRYTKEWYSGSGPNAGQGFTDSVKDERFKDL